MENATKALIIAGSVLLSIIVLSIFMLMVNSLTEYQQAQTQMGQTQDVISFNNQFQGYMRDDITGTDVLSVINKVLYYNRTKAIDAIGIEDAGNGYVYEPIKLVIEMDGKQGNLAMDGSDNKLFDGTRSTYTFSKDKNIEEMDEPFAKIDALLNKTKMPTPPQNSFLQEKYRNTRTIYYSEGILKGLMDNYGSEKSIFVQVSSTDPSDTEKIRNENKKKFAEFNRIIGTIYFPLVDRNGNPLENSAYTSWWDSYFGPSPSKSNLKYKYKKVDGVEVENTEMITIKQAVELYYEYAQFQRGKFKYVQPTSGEETYSSSSGRIKYLKFVYTGESI